MAKEWYVGYVQDEADRVAAFPVKMSPKEAKAVRKFIAQYHSENMGAAQANIGFSGKTFQNRNEAEEYAKVLVAGARNTGEGYVDDLLRRWTAFAASDTVQCMFS